MIKVLKILRQQIYCRLITNQYKITLDVQSRVENFTFNLRLALSSVGLKNNHIS